MFKYLKVKYKMGIKNLNKFLREKSPNIFEQIHLSEYAFKKVAIDISLYLFKFKAVCGDRWLSAFINLISSLRRNEIHCVFIYDGQSPPEKEDEKAKRKLDKEKLQDQVCKLEDALDLYHRTGEIDKILQDLYTKRKQSPQQKRLLGDNQKGTIDMKWVEERLKQKNNQIIDIRPQDFQFTKNLFDILQVPYYTAIGEAEKMCSKLCIDGIVDAVLSEDTDVIAYGTPFFLSKIDTYSDTCVRISNNSVLKELCLDSQDQLIDFCIMCGTDYNDNIPKVGAHTSYKHIITHKNIENIEKNTGLDGGILKYKRGRELFTEFDNYNISSIPYCGFPDFTLLAEFNKKHRLEINMEKITKDFTREIIFEDSDEEL